MSHTRPTGHVPNGLWAVKSCCSPLPPPSSNAAAAAGSPVIFTLWAQRLRPSRCTAACWQDRPVPISCWAPNNEARRVDGETRWHASSGCSCLFAEVEAQRSGPAAHGQRPVSGQPDTRRTPGHCSVSPPGGRTVLGAADHQLMHGWVRSGTGACRRTQGNTSAHWGLKKQKKEGEPFVNSSHSSLAVKKKPHTSLRRWGARTCKIFFVCTELHPCRLLQFFYLIWDFHREKNKPNNNSCISHCQFISVFSVLLIGSL